MTAGTVEPPPGPEPAFEPGAVEPALATEFEGLGIVTVELDASPGRSPEAVRQRLRDLSDRFYGGHAIHLRERPVPWAYRVFFRHIGLDPDLTPTPVEQLARERLQDGAFKSRGLPADALAIATIETGVALRALDAERLTGEVTLRSSTPGEALDGEELALGTLVLADQRAPVGLLFGAAADAPSVTKRTRRLRIVAIQVGGVPQMAVDEALRIAVDALREV